jgi:PilZ domain
MDSREHRRVRMRLPVRLRWATPFGQKIELGETIDVSRSGVLVSTKEPHNSGVPLWVTFPYDSAPGDGQPEMFARIVRCGEVLEVIRAANAREKVQSKSASAAERSAKLDQLARALAICDAPATFAVAIQFEEHANTSPNGNSHRSEPERRGSPRRALAVPVCVRPEPIPWFEEAMTIDFSVEGMRFRSHREYELGEQLKIKFGDATPTLWLGTGEFRSMVVRVAPAPDIFALDVSVCRVK